MRRSAAADGPSGGSGAGWGRHGFTILFAVLSLLLQFFIPRTCWLTHVPLAYVALFFGVKIDWPTVAKGLVVPGIAGAGAMAVFVAILGTTISPYLIWQASQEVEGLKQDRHRQPFRNASIQAKRPPSRICWDMSGGMAVSISSRLRSCRATRQVRSLRQFMVAAPAGWRLSS